MKILALIAIIFASIALFIVIEKRDKELMSLCADHETRTLYKCN